MSDFSQSGEEEELLVRHRIMVRRGDVTAVRERIERRLGVETSIMPVPKRYGGGWDIDFTAPKDIDLDFLRPDVLPPKEYNPPASIYEARERGIG